MADGLFAGLKVIDCASFIAAPAAATVLSDFGADVIKIEPPGEGDLYRSLHTRPGSPKSSRDYAWMLDSRNKRGLALDLKSPQGHEVLQRLVTSADIFITNMPLPVRRRLKTAYKDLSPLNPRLIYASFTAYGESGPEAEKTGFDSTAYWARSGLMDVVRPDAEATPARSAPGMGDHPSAMALYGAILTALYRRERTGKGGQVSSSLVANGLWSNSYFVQAKLIGSEFPPRPPRTHTINPLSNSYRCKDHRWFILSMVNEARQFAPFMEAIGLSDLIPRFHLQAARQKHSPELIAIFDKLFAEKTLAEWRKILDDAGITFGVVGTLDDIVHDEQARHAGAIVKLADGSAETVSSPFQVDGETKRAPAAAPGIGQHTDEILREVGYSAAEITRLREAKAVA